jgi:hypothetical protein
MSGEVSRDIIGAMAVGPRAKPARTFPSGRTCQRPGCGVRLSVYNSSSACGLHAHFEAVAHTARPARQRDSGRVGIFGPTRVAA